jgi:hypothetical protein
MPDVSGLHVAIFLSLPRSPRPSPGDAMQTATNPDVERAWTRGLVLVAVLLIAALLTRCPIADLHDTPVPPPSSYGGH